MKQRAFSLMLLIGIGLFVPSVLAESPSAIQQMSADGDHYRAMVAWERSSKRQMTPQAILAAAESSWALGLEAQALDLVSKAVATGQLTKREHARALIMQAVVHRQRGEFDLSYLRASHAREQVTQDDPFAVRAGVILVDVLIEQRKYEQARILAKQTKVYAEPDLKAELTFKEAQAARAREDESGARTLLLEIPRNHGRAAETLRLLSELAVSRGDFNEAKLFLERGREDFPDKFLDSWTLYQLAKASAEMGERNKAEDYIVELQRSFPESDPWRVVAIAYMEQKAWRHQ